VNDNTTVTLELNAATADATPRVDHPPVDLSALQEIQKGIDTLFDPNDVVEVRVPKAGKLGTVSGYFLASCPEVAPAIQKLDGKHPGIYTTLNPVNPALLARAENRTKAHAQTTTSDPDIIRRIHLLIDADPVRPAGISSTDEEKEHSRIQTRAVFKHLRSRGWPDPTVADSGNGFHLIYNIDLPNDKDAANLVKAVLNALAAKFHTPESKIDVSVFNAARIVKAYGTLAAKGDDIESRPHRRSKVLTVGSGVVTREQLQAIAGEVSSPAPTNKPISGMVIGTPHGFTPEQIEEKLELCGITHHGLADGTIKGQSKWVLDNCPFNPDHAGKDAAVFLTDGIPGFKCLHNSCADNHWKEFRAKAEELSGQKMFSGGKATEDISSHAEVEVFDSESKSASAPLPLTMPDSVLDGRLGELIQHAMERFPLDYAWTALVTAAGTLVPRTAPEGMLIGGDPKPRANLFSCLIGPVHSGKSVAIEQALFKLGMQPGQQHHDHLLELKSGSAEGLIATVDNVAGESRLFSPDELIHLLDKIAIANSSFQAVFNTAFDKNRQVVTMARGKQVTFNCRLSLLGGLVERMFDSAFGAQTTGGLYDRMLFGYCDDKTPHLYEPPDESADILEPVPVTIAPDVQEATHEWIKAGMNGRVVQIVQRVAVICASFSGNPVLRAKDLGPAYALAHYQERLRKKFAPNEGDNPVAIFSNRIKTHLEQHAGMYVTKRQIYRAINADRYGPEHFNRAMDALVRSEEVFKTKCGKREVFALNGDMLLETHKAADNAQWNNLKVTISTKGEGQ
jgi:hypothetical protein